MADRLEVRLHGEQIGWIARAPGRVTVPSGVAAPAAAQLAWNVERLQAGAEIGERPSRYRRRRSGW